ncbi:MAG: ribosome-associated translation inhibitor RaiA [Alphaproteobacteria bacterium]
MQISVKGRQLDVGDALRVHVTRAMESLVGRFFDQPIDATVVFSREGHAFRADITAHPSRGVLVQGGAVGDDAYVAFDAAAGRVERQLGRYKSRLTQRARGEGGEGEIVEAQQFIIAADEADESPVDEHHQPVIIAEMAADVPVCTVSGAVMRLDLANAPAMMFRNSAHGGLNMVYRRPDGNIGWIDPQGGPGKGA